MEAGHVRSKGRESLLYKVQGTAGAKGGKHRGVVSERWCVEEADAKPKHVVSRPGVKIDNAAGARARATASSCSSEEVPTLASRLARTPPSLFCIT